jgi:hypothetical protein
MDFKERFKGKTDFMKKDGHIGLVHNTSKPIEKSLVSYDSSLL